MRHTLCVRDLRRCWKPTKTIICDCAVPPIRSDPPLSPLWIILMAMSVIAYESVAGSHVACLHQGETNASSNSTFDIPGIGLRLLMFCRYCVVTQPASAYVVGIRQEPQPVVAGRVQRGCQTSEVNTVLSCLQRIGFMSQDSCLNGKRPRFWRL